MAESVWPNVVSGVGGLLGSLITTQANWKMNQENNKLQMDLANQAYAQNLAQWERENAYNSPSAQLQRLKSAGLNPSMLYGQGAPMNVAGESPQKEIASTQAIQMQDPISSGINSALLAAQIRNTNADTDVKQSEIPVNEQRANELKASASRLTAEAQGLGIANSIASLTKASDVASKIARNELSEKQAKEEVQYVAQNAKTMADKLVTELEIAKKQDLISAEELNRAKALAASAVAQQEIDEYAAQYAGFSFWFDKAMQVGDMVVDIVSILVGLKKKGLSIVIPDSAEDLVKNSKDKK